MFQAKVLVLVLVLGLAHGVAYQRDILTTHLCLIAFCNSQKPTYFVVSPKMFGQKTKLFIFSNLWHN